LDSIGLITRALSGSVVLRKRVIHTRAPASEGQETYEDSCCFHHLSLKKLTGLDLSPIANPLSFLKQKEALQHFPVLA
jgi:hypothetical protein